MKWARYFVPTFLIDLCLCLDHYGMGLIVKKELGGGPIELSYLTSCYIGAYVVFCPLAAGIALRVGRLRLIAGSTVLLAVASGAVPWLGRAVEAYYGAAAVLGIASAMFWPTIQAHLSDASAAEALAGNLGIFNLSWAAGEALGLLLPGLLFASGPRLVFGLAVAGGAITAASILGAPRDPVAPSEPPGTARPGWPPAASGDAPAPVSGYFFYLGLIFNFVAWGSYRAVVGLFPDLGETALGLSPAGQGGLLFLAAVGQMATFAVLMRWKGWVYRPGLILGTTAGLATAFALLYAVATVRPPGTPLLAGALLLLFAAVVGFSYFSSILYSVADERVRWQRAGIHEAVLGAGAVILPLYGGRAAALAGRSSAAFLGLAVLVGAGAAAMLLLLAFGRGGKRSVEPPGGGGPAAPVGGGSYVRGG